MSAPVPALLRDIAHMIGPVAGEAAGLEARRILAHAAGVEPARVPLLDHFSDSRAGEARALAARRAAGEPLAYVLGTVGFWTIDLKVGPGVLIPRSDTETLIRRALRLLEEAPAPRILDLGTGSGAILLALLSERADAWGLGVDRSAPALDYARANARALGLTRRVAFIRGDWDAALRGSFDLILSNPPYIDSADATLDASVRDHEPHAALFAEEDGLAAHRRVAAACARLLRSGGVFAVEIGHEQKAAATALYAAAGLHPAGCDRDLADRARVVWGRRTESV